VQNAKTGKEIYLYFRHLGPQDTGEFVQYGRRKMCPLLSAHCRMCPFYCQDTYSTLVDSPAHSALTDFISPKNKNVWRFRSCWLSPPV